MLAKRGARLVLPARSLKAAEEAKARLASDCPGSDIVVLPLDLSSLCSVRNFVSQFHSLNLPLNLLMYVYILNKKKRLFCLCVYYYGCLVLEKMMEIQFRSYCFGTRLKTSKENLWLA